MNFEATVWIVCGSRHLPQGPLVARLLTSIGEGWGGPQTVCFGDADGADAAAWHWAKAQGVPFQRFRAVWTRHQKAAGRIRTAQMVKEARCLAHETDILCIAFPMAGKKNTGTLDTVGRCARAGIRVVISAVSRETHNQDLTKPQK